MCKHIKYEAFRAVDHDSEMEDTPADADLSDPQVPVADD